MNQIENDLLELHAKFHKWVRESRHDYSLAVKAEDSYSYVQADTQGAFDAFCAGIIVGMEEYENCEPKKVILNLKLELIDKNYSFGEVRQNVFGVIQKDRKGVYLDRVSEPGILRPESSPVSALNQNKPVLVTSEARTESEEKALELYRTHLHEFMTTSHPEPDFRAYGVGDRFYASLDERQKLYILNKFVAGSFRLTTDKELENKFTEHFRHRYYFEENAEKVRRLAGYKTASLNKQG